MARTHAIALVGVEGHEVEIEADIQNGLPGLLLIGGLKSQGGTGVGRQPTPDFHARAASPQGYPD